MTTRTKTVFVIPSILLVALAGGVLYSQHASSRNASNPEKMRPGKMPYGKGMPGEQMAPTVNTKEVAFKVSAKVSDKVPLDTPGLAKLLEHLNGLPDVVGWEDALELDRYELGGWHSTITDVEEKEGASKVTVSVTVVLLEGNSPVIAMGGRDTYLLQPNGKFKVIDSTPPTRFAAP